MSRQFYSLPEPGELGLKWKAYEEGKDPQETPTNGAPGAGGGCGRLSRPSMRTRQGRG
jgi:hypothetical protein